MTLGDALGISKSQERLIARGMQFVLGTLLISGLVTLRVEIAVNAGLALVVTLLPALLRREYGYSMDAGLVLLITAAVLLHSLDSIGLYRWFSWYDEVTHTVSAILVAGIGYAVLRAFERHSDEVFEFTAVEFFEILGVNSPVRVFGIDDIVTDMIFNAVGTALVAIWGMKYFDDFVPFFERRLRSRDNDQ